MIEVQKAVIKKDNLFLTLLRSPKAEFYPEHWDFPGGKLEEGEDRIKGIEREVFEETTLNVNAGNVIGIYEMSIKGIPHRFTLYATKQILGTVKLSSEHLDFRWATKKEILKLKTEPYIKLYFDETKE